MNAEREMPSHISRAKVPTKYGMLDLYCFNQNNIENVAITYGTIDHQSNVLTRIHSECFTGDLLGSLKCDCGDQLDTALKKIIENKSGLIIYLKQEGRGIGLLNKLKAYTLQDNENMDTVEANLHLGHEIDSRTYEDAIEMLRFFNIQSVQLITNNPEKINALKAANITVKQFISIHPKVNTFNKNYLETKNEKLNHLIQLHPKKSLGELKITAAYAQSINGAISLDNLQPVQLSNEDSLVLTHKLRAEHDAILVGINTIMQDDPRLTLRHYSGTDPQPCILDTHLNLDIEKRIFKHPRKPWVFTASTDTNKIKRLENHGAKIFQVELTEKNIIHLKQVVHILENEGMRSLIVEGGKKVLTRFLDEQLVSTCIITIAPVFMNGTNILEKQTKFRLSSDIILENIQTHLLSNNIILEGSPRHV